MIIKIKKGVIYRLENEIETPIGSLFDHATDEDEKTIECGVEMLPKVQEFIDNVNSGSFKPRSVVKELESVLRKYE